MSMQMVRIDLKDPKLPQKICDLSERFHPDTNKAGDFIISILLSAAQAMKDAGLGIETLITLCLLVGCEVERRAQAEEKVSYSTSGSTVQ